MNRARQVSEFTFQLPDGIRSLRMSSKIANVQREEIADQNRAVVPVS